MSGVFPANHYFRRSSSAHWITTINGAVASNTLAYNSSAVCIDFDHNAQHRPVEVTLHTQPVIEDSFAWIHPPPKGPGGLLILSLRLTHCFMLGLGS